MSRTSEFYKKNPESAEKRREAQRKINKKPSQKKLFLLLKNTSTVTKGPIGVDCE